MHSELLHQAADDSIESYSYLLEWEWPEHIELLLRRLIWSRLVELGQENVAEGREVEVDPSDHLAARVCWLIAVSPKTHPAVLDVLAGNHSSAFAERIAENPNAAASTLARLAGHSSTNVRCAVAENANTPIEVVGILAKDEDVDVRYGLAENHNLPTEILQELSEDDNAYVAARARKTLCRLAPPEVATMPFKRSLQSVKPERKAALG